MANQVRQNHSFHPFPSIGTECSDARTFSGSDPTQVGPPTFADAAAVADLIFKSGAKYDSIVIVYNKFVSALSFEAASVEVQTETSLREARE